MGTEGLKLTNGIGYLWAEQEIHKIAAIYGHGYGADTNQTVTYYYGGPNDQDGSITAGTVEAQQGIKTTLSLQSGARALTVEDVNKICGHDSTYTVNYSSATVAKGSSNAKFYPTLNTTNTATGQSETQTTFSGDYYETKYNYTISSANSNIEAQAKQNEILKLGKNYWLASRSMIVSNGSSGFYANYVNTSNAVGGSGSYLCGCNASGWNTGSPTHAVRAVVTLKSGIKTSDTVYNQSTGWNIID